MSWLRTVSGGVEFQVRVTPRSSRESVDGIHDDALKVRLTAPPVDGKVNAALARLLAKRLHAPTRAITIARGEAGRRKCIRVAGVTVRQVAEAFAVAPPSQTVAGSRACPAHRGDPGPASPPLGGQARKPATGGR
jgi:uncharacterized protein (TIGR00251 family)